MKQTWLLHLLLEVWRTCDEMSAELNPHHHPTLTAGKPPIRHTDTLNNHKHDDDREVAQHRVERKPVFRLPLRSAAVQYSAWWTLPCSEIRRQKNSATRKSSGPSRRQEGKWAKFWLTQVVSLRFSIFCNKEKHQQVVRSDQILNNKPRTLGDTIKLKSH